MVAVVESPVSRRYCDCDIAAWRLGRPLQPWEVVYHIDVTVGMRMTTRITSGFYRD